MSMGQEKNRNKFIKICKKIFGNKYLFVLTLWTIWIGFVDEDCFMTSIEIHHKISERVKEINEVQKEIEECKKQSILLRSSNENLEHFAREQYFMKKSNEDIYKLE